MSSILILSSKTILKKEEEEALARDNVQVTKLTDYSQDIAQYINGDYDYILLDNALGSTDIYQVRRVGIIGGKKPELKRDNIPIHSITGADRIPE